MLRVMVDKQVAIMILGILTLIGVGSKCIVNSQLKRLVRGAENMSKSDHPLMRLMRAKFEHACMVSAKVKNVEVFVDKYLYEYRVLGIRLHSLRRLEKAAAFLCVIVGAMGALASYRVEGMGENVYRIGGVGAALGVLIYVFHLTTDENYRLQMARNYMVDYLQNVCLHKYEKAYQREEERREEELKGENQKQEEFQKESAIEIQEKEKIQAVEQTNPEEGDADDKIDIIEMEAEEEKILEKPVDKDVLIRQILEEFMA